MHKTAKPLRFKTESLSTVLLSLVFLPEEGISKVQMSPH